MTKPTVTVMTDKASKGIQFISYYNLVVAFVLVFGLAALFIFAKTKGTPDQNFPVGSLLVPIACALFYAFSAFNYLGHKEYGRICLLGSCVIQIMTSIKDLVVTYSVTISLQAVNIVILLVGLWGLWFLNTAPAKAWSHITKG